MDTVRRRAFMKGAAAGALVFTVGGAEVLLLPREARAQNIPFKVLTADDAQRLEAVADALVPGAREAGVAHFVDQQCSVQPHEALLQIRISNVRPPFVDFYRAALAAIDRQCEAAHGRPFARLSAQEQLAFIGTMRVGKHADWKGPPTQQAIYAALRADGVDVVYGTVDGFERLGVPYMAHILPPTRW
ncbi:MAG: gluconate 2-dehydrogenase subunit 3 family protein [Hyphomicrobiales bacterium]|nr:gluconate 2-dehydrogenase subunit 3 family protein [Hyphomicrobiales bacterium]